MTELRGQPRFDAVPLERGHYESFFVRAGHPAERLAIWIRYTIHKRPGARPRGSLWFTLFDPASGPPRAVKATLEPDELSTGSGRYIAIGDSRLEPGRLVGTAAAAGASAAWDLTFADGEPPFEHLPRAWMYRAPLPRTKVESLHPAARFNGKVTLDGRSVALDGWPGVIGHNWGREHAERWIWMYGSAFEGDSAAWFDAALGRVRVGPATLPWVANACLSIGGERHRLAGVAGVRGARVDERASECDFALRGAAVTVRGRAAAAPADMVGWVYADPDGGEHNTLNCSCASLELRVERSGAAPLTLRTACGGAYEIGMRERDHGVPIQPFTDG